VWLESLGQVKNSNEFNRNRTHDVPTCSIVPEPTMLLRAQLFENPYQQGRAIAQAVSRWLPTAAALFRCRIWLSEICGEQSSTEASFVRELRFPLPIFIPPNFPSS
jgi:hypothetical protein